MSKIREAIILNFLFPLADKLMGTCAMKWYGQIKLMNTWSKEQIDNWQNKQLQVFIRHAYDNTIYYKNLFDELRLTPDDIKTKEDLKKLPIINKDIVNKNYENLIPSNIKQIRYRKARTGGTTGEPMRYLCDENTWGYVTGAKIYAWKKTGYHYADKFVALGSSSLFSKKPSFPRRIYDKMRNEIALNGINLSDEICECYVEIIKKKKVRFLYGYAASLYLLAKYVDTNGIDLKMDVVFTTSEKLTDIYREKIIKAFHCKVMDCYGAKDAGITAFEIEKGIYPISYNSIAETLNDKKGGSGKLLTTNVLNYAFPLIRYEFGDEAVLSNNYKNYNGQVLLDIIGRSSDVIILKNGNKITGPGFTILMKPFDIEAYQIRQISEREIELDILPGESFDKNQESIIFDEVLRFLGKDCILKIIYVDKFEPLKNGKRRYFMVE